MPILQQLSGRNAEHHEPFLIGPGGSLSFDDVSRAIGRSTDLAAIPRGAVVALVGDFDGPTIAMMLELLDRGVVLMPLATGTTADHEYFFEAGRAEWVIRDGEVERRQGTPDAHPLIEDVRARNHPGIIFFSSGTTGRPKALLHDFDNFLAR